MKGIALAVVAAVGILMLVPAAALAHAVLLKTTPSSSESLSSAPSQVQLLFSEPLDPAFSHVQVRDASGQLVDNGDSQVDPNNDQLLTASLRAGLPNGVYTVEWRNLSAIDVHPDAGQYRLFVGVPVQTGDLTSASTASTLSATPETTLGRWWFYVAASLFGGVLATWKLVLAPLVADARPGLQSKTRSRAYWLIVSGGVLLIVGTLFTAVAQAAAAANVPLAGGLGSPLGELLLRGRYASIWWPRLGLEIASLLLIVFGGIDGLASECALATLPAVLLTSALTSHGAALPNAAAPGIAIDWLHIVGACAWVGGLAALAAFLPALRAEPDAGVTPAQLVGRFGRLALVAAAVVLLSGVLQGALELGSPSALTTTLYGQLLLVKAGLFLAMLLLAGMNELRVRAALGASSSATAQVRGLSAGIGIELTLGVIVFAVAALLSSTPPSPVT
ncbi:MAG TPA: CopD family protein [Chloroflexota bacterium]